MSNYALERSVKGFSERAGRASPGPLNADVRPKMKSVDIVVPTLLSMSLQVGCTSITDRGSDEFCRKLAQFANATEMKAIRSVELRTDWGNWAKACSYEEYEPGKQYCEWLMEHTSTEFAHVNIRRALNCLDDSGPYAGFGRATPEFLTGKVRSYESRYTDDDVLIEVEYRDGIEGELPMLRITAERWTLD